MTLQSLGKSRNVPRVTHREIVFGFDNGAFFVHVAGYHLLTLVIPYVVDLFELVGIYPRPEFALCLVEFRPEQWLYM